MKIKLIVLTILLNYLSYYSCSIYKITKFGKTFVGNNMDNWDSNTHIWFEKGSATEYGSMFFGFEDLYPQGGMNEKGLVYGGLNVTPRANEKGKHLLQFDGRVVMKKIMKECKNVDEVYKILSKYNRTPIGDGELYFVDKMGGYLIVEVDTIIRGNDDNYLISNFCPSQTPDLNAVKIPFFQKGRKMMATKVDTSFNYLKSLSDTLHQSFANNAGGTLYTAIYDLNEGTFNLFFYHDYNYSLKFNLKNELSKRDTILSIPALFKANIKGQEQFIKYNKTEQLIGIIKEKELSNDSIKMAQYIKVEEIGAFINFFEKDIYFLAYDFLKKDRRSSAINLFKLNIKYCPYSWFSYSSLGDIYFSDKQYALALIYYNKTLELNPEKENTLKKIKTVNKLLKN
jgi:hypothetical protein